MNQQDVRLVEKLRNNKIIEDNYKVCFLRAIELFYSSFNKKIWQHIIRKFPDFFCYIEFNDFTIVQLSACSTSDWLIRLTKDSFNS